MRTFIVALVVALFPFLACAAEILEQASAPPRPWEPRAKYVMSVARDPFTGALWVGTEDWGVYKYEANGRQLHWGTKSPNNPMVEEASLALAIDQQGRTWVGHATKGVSVFDGKTWKNYDPMTGLAGSRVFTIKVCPAGEFAGDVWIATDGGLTRYKPKEDAWVSYTRADGLPADQVQCMAFDAEGRLILGMQCEGIAIGSPANNYSAWDHIEGPDRPGTEPIGKGLPSCMINDVLAAKDGTIYVATPWGLGKSIDGAKTFTYRRGTDFVSKVKARTGGAPADFKQPGNVSQVAEDYVTSLAEDQAGLLWIGYRSEGYEAVDEANEAGKHAAAGAPEPGKFGEHITCILPVPGAGPLVGTYGAGLLQSEKYFVLANAPQPPAPAPLAAIGAHPSEAAPLSPKALDAVRAKLALAVMPPAGKAQPVSGFLGDDWSTQGDGIGRYGRQNYFYPRYGMAGWSSNYACNLAVGPHQSKNKGGPWTYAHKNDLTDRRVQYIPNDSKRIQCEWNDGSFDRDAYHDDWEGPDLWIDITVPEGTHRASLYFINYDAHSVNNRRRDFLVELKNGDVPIPQADFAPTIARSRVYQFYTGVYKQFILAGPAKYYIKINRNYSMCTKLSAIFFDRLEGPVKPNVPEGVPIMGESQVKPPAMGQDPAASTNVALRAAGEITAQLNKEWSNRGALAFQKPLRLEAIRLAASQGAGNDVLDNWRFALPLMTAEDHAQFLKTTTAAADHFFIMNPHAAETVLRKQFEDAWKKLGPQIVAGGGPKPADIVAAGAKPDPTDVLAIRAVLAPYLLARAGKQIEPRSLSTQEESPIGFFNDIKGVGTDAKALYQRTGEFVLFSQSLSERTNDKARRQGLASAMAATRASLELVDDTWLAARLAEAFLIPQLSAAGTEGPTARPAVLALFVAAHTDDVDGMAKCITQLLAAAKTAGAADALRFEVAQALGAAHKAALARGYLSAIPAPRRSAEVTALLKELEGKP